MALHFDPCGGRVMTSTQNYTVADDFWSWVAVGFQYLFLTAQIAAFARMVFCYRRASKIWKGEVSS